MKDLIFTAVSTFLPLTLLHLLSEGTPLMAQPGQGQPQGAASPGQGLGAYSLPPGQITEKDIPRIKTVMQDVLKTLSESNKSGKKRSDYQDIRSGILSFQQWLKQQGCVSRASTTYDLDATDRYAENIFVPYPGQLPFDIVFRMGGDTERQYRLMIFVSTVDFLDFGSLVENKSVAGVAALGNWPSSYMDVRPRI